MTQKTVIITGNCKKY